MLNLSREEAELRRAEIYKSPDFLDGSPLTRQTFTRELRDLNLILYGDELLYIHGADHTPYQHGSEDDAA